MNGFFRKLVVLLVLAAVVRWGWAPVGFAQTPGPQMVDSVEDYQKKLETLITERLRAVVPSGNFLLRLFVLGQNVEVPLPVAERDTFSLPGFQKQGVQTGPRTATKFRVERITVSVVVNEALAEQEADYIRTIVPLLAEFREARGDELKLRVVPPAEKPRAPGDATAKDAKGGALSELETRDWILLGALALILLLLVVVLLRVLFQPKPRPAAEPQQMPHQGAPSPAAVDARAQKEAEDELKERESAAQLAVLRQNVVKGLFARQDIGRELIQAWQNQPAKVGGLIHALGPAIARQAMLPHLDRERYKSLEELVRTDAKPPTTEKLIDLMREASLFFVAQELVNPEQVRPDPFAFLRKLSWGQAAHLVSDEPVNIKAIILSRLDPADTARIMETQPQEMQLEIAVQIGNLRSMPLDMAQSVAQDLAIKARTLPDAKTVDIVGPKALVDVMGRASLATSTYLLGAMKAKDTQLSEAVERRFFLFEAIPLVPPELLPRVVRSLPSETVVQALQGADQDIQRIVIMAFPEQARTGLVTTLRAAQHNEETVMEARRKVVTAFQDLAEQGKIDLKQISDAWQAKAS